MSPEFDRSRLSKKKKNKDENEQFRPVDDKLLQGILTDNENKNTVKSEKNVDKILVKYLQQTNQNLDYINYSVDDLD